MASKRAVVVGAGEIANAWFPVLIKEEVEVAGVVELDVEKARGKLAEYGLDAAVGSDLAEMLEKTKPDFVVDLTVPEAHCATTCTAMEGGCHVIGEKPMASSMDEARKMVKTSEKTGRMYMVSQSRRWDGNYAAIRQVVDEKMIGQIIIINCDFYAGAHFGGFRDEMQSPLILDMAIHHFDLARLISGLDSVAVYTKEFNPNGSWYAGDAAASCVFEMSNGVIFTYRGCWCAEGCHTSWNGNWRIIGNKGTVICEHDKPPHGQVVAGDEGFQRPLKELEMPQAKVEFTEMHGALREMLEFLRTGKATQTECHDNIKSLAMVFAAIESSKQGKRISIKAM